MWVRPKTNNYKKKEWPQTASFTVQTFGMNSHQGLKGQCYEIF
jgi:hypothetical protein